MSGTNEIVLNVMEIEPRVRHQTIFQTYDNLKESESLRIHVNHDPKPLYYQLKETRGDVFNWEYLQQGPEWFDIRITKKPATKPSLQSDREGELVIDVPAIGNHQMKHATILQAFDHLEPGESFVIHNDHDPKPLYYQLMDLHGDIFTWTYLENGPQWWDIRVEKKSTKGAQMSNKEIVLDIPSIEPRLKHETIFKTFESLKPGESFIIHNNHDPRPVYYQLMELYGNVFTWTYLQQGPQWYDIRVALNRTPENQEIGADEVVLNIPAIGDHRLKHATIFQTFEKTQPGKSFIIHNDHDPKPVFFQLTSLYGDTFTWDYLQQGPQWWNIRVTKKGSTPATAKQEPAVAIEKPQDAQPIGANGETVIDVPSIEPRLKHPTIFKVFDELKPGQSLVIHNDHDPKPLFYQLKAERGDIFTWTYLQQGPEWFDIRVKKLGADDLDTVGRIVSKDIRKATIFRKYGIDYCCEGHKTVKQACKDLGIDAAAVENELQQPIAGNATQSMNFDDMDLEFLSDYIQKIHHRYVRKYLPEIVGYTNKVRQVHLDKHPELDRVKELVDNINEELNQLIKVSEDELFPTVKVMERAKEAGEKLKGNDFASAVRNTEYAQMNVIKSLQEIRKLTNNYEIPEDACTSYKLLYQMLQEFEDDLMVHFHLKNNILFAKAKEIDQAVR